MRQQEYLTLKQECTTPRRGSGNIGRGGFKIVTAIAIAAMYQPLGQGQVHKTHGTQCASMNRTHMHVQNKKNSGRLAGVHVCLLKV